VLELAPSQNGTQPGVANWKVGAPVFVLVMMINNTSRTIHYSLRNSAFDYEMDVRDASGRPVPESESFRKLKEQVKNSPWKKHFGYLEARGNGTRCGWSQWSL
jgi:hypothetical protein